MRRTPPNGSGAPSARRSSAARWSWRWRCSGFRCRRGCDRGHPATCYNPSDVVQTSETMHLNIDLALRTLIVLAGAVAALLLALKGEGPALPALAVGGTVGACMMAR